AEIVVRADPADPRGEMGLTIESHRQLIALCGREIHHLPAAVFAEVRESCPRLPRGADNRYRIAEHFNAACTDRRICRANRPAIRAGVECDVVIQELAHTSVTIHVSRVRKNEILNEALLEVHPPVLEI